MEAADTSAPEEQAVADEAGEGRGGFGSLGSILLLLVLTWSAYLALIPLNDNSFFTHLATGRIILDEGSVPSSDPYTYTANGEPWTVQSWLASVAYAGAERLGGASGLRVLVLLVFLLAGALLWRLTEAAEFVFPRLAILLVALVVATDAWSERPYMVGFIGLSLVWLALDGVFRPSLLVPYMWLWGNTHGSFPLAVTLCVAVIAGTLLDRRHGEDGSVRVELRVLGAVILGALIAGISPLGHRALTFPLRALTRAGSLSDIVEWQSPEFTSTADRALLILVLAATAAVVSTQRWRHAMPVMAFTAAAVLAQRNIVMAIPVLVPVISASAPRVGTLRSATRPRLGAPLAAAIGVLLALVVGSMLDRPALGLGGYPTRPLAFVGSDVRVRMVNQDFTGNLLEALDGASNEIFVDDRADMFPSDVLNDFEALNKASPQWSEVLLRWDARLVVWKRHHPLAAVLAADARWRIEFSDSEWCVARRRVGDGAV